MTPPLRVEGGEVVRQMLLDVGGWGVSECSGRPTIIYAEPNINIL